MNIRAMQLSKIIAASLLLFTVGILTACSKDIPPPDNALQDYEELRGAIDARVENVDDARFHDVTLEYFGDGQRIRVRQLILVRSPDHLRVQTRLPGSDEILSLLVSDGETFALHERDENKYYTGAPTRENINRLLPVDLSGQDVVRVMLGAAPWDRFDAEPGTPELEWDRDEGHYRYRVERQNGNQLVMHVRHTDYAVLGVEETNPDGETVYAYTTEGWDNAGPLALPSFQRFQWPERDLDFSIAVGHREFNVELGTQLFQFAPPPGSQVIDVQ